MFALSEPRRYPGRSQPSCEHQPQADTSGSKRGKRNQTRRATAFVGLIVIDPMRGFTDTAGSLARNHGLAELAEIQATVTRPSEAISRHVGPSI